MTATTADPNALKGEDWAGEMGIKWLTHIDRFEGMIAPIGDALLARASDHAGGAGDRSGVRRGIDLAHGSAGDRAGGCGAGAGYFARSDRRGPPPRAKASPTSASSAPMPPPSRSTPPMTG